MSVEVSYSVSQLHHYHNYIAYDHTPALSLKYYHSCVRIYIHLYTPMIIYTHNTQSSHICSRSLILTYMCVCVCVFVCVYVCVCVCVCVCDDKAMINGKSL